jgi:adenosine deaminase
MERAMLKYPVRAGIILCLDRRFTEQENYGIVKKAIKYKARGVVGIDLAGPITRNDQSKQFRPRDIAKMVAEAKDHGLGVTIHTGEATGTDEMWEVLTELKPDRIGHGMACVTDQKMMNYLAENKIVLETCPTSNLNTKTVANIDELRTIYQTYKENKIPFTINTDGPEMQLISLRGEYEKLLVNNILTEEDLLQANQTAHAATFIDYDKLS